jgi:H+/Cl- antiporter ClcA
MKFNCNQKRIFFIGLLFIAAAILVWVGFGAEIFTKTQVLVEKQDELLGTSYKEWEDQFVLGLDYTVGISGLIILSSSIIVWRQRKSRS